MKIVKSLLIQIRLSTSATTRIVGYLNIGLTAGCALLSSFVGAFFEHFPVEIF